METRVVTDEGVWNYPLVRAKNSQFLQSWEWGVFQQTLQRRVRRAQVMDGETPVAAIQLVEHDLPFGHRYWYAPRGPVLFTSDVDLYDTVTQGLLRLTRTMAAEIRPTFFRFEPVGALSLTVEHFAPLGFRPGVTVQPQDELALRVGKSEDELLGVMHEKTRYNVRLAEKHGVRARLIEQADYARRVFPIFWQLLTDTAKRQRIRTYPRGYYAQMLDVLIPRGVVKLMVAEHDGTIIAGHLLTVFGDTVYYLHGGASYEHRSLMAPYLLHWEGIRLTKRLGKTYYNLGGINPVDKKDHPWHNLTRFKEGFVAVGEMGERFHYLDTLDFVSQPLWYRMYTAARRVRQLVRFG